MLRVNEFQGLSVDQADFTLPPQGLSVAKMKGSVFKNSYMGEGIEIREFWPTIGYPLTGNC